MRLGVRCSSLAIAVALCLVGCGGSANRAAVEEMNQQQAEMEREQTQWANTIEGWKTEHVQMKTWHQENARVGADSDADALTQHLDKVAQHEQDVTRFEQDLDALHSKMDQHGAKPERTKLTDHAALWTEHMKHKITFATLENSHQSLMKEHAEWMTKAVRPS